MSYASLRALTDLTGADATKDRTTVIATFEVSYPALWAAIWGMIPGLVVGGVLNSIFGVSGGLIGFMVGMGLTMWLILGQSSTGLKRKHYQTLKDRNAYRPGEFTLCGKPIDPQMALTVRVVSASVPLLPRDTSLDLEDAFGIEEREPVLKREVDATAFSPLAAPRRSRRTAHHSGHKTLAIVDESSDVHDTLIAPNWIEERQ